MNSLEQYPRRVRLLSDEILEAFSDDEVDVLFDLLSDLGFIAWRDWKDEHHPLIVEYIQATPAQRKKHKKFTSQSPQLAFAAYQQILAGHEVLLLIESNLLFPGQSYRGMAASAANFYKELYDAIEHERWPWDGDPYYRGT